MAHIVSEKNSKRKAHRISVPLLVEIDKHVYESKDWSVDGIGILECPLELEVDQKIPARIIFPITDSTLAISVTLICKNTVNGNIGFAFDNLSHKHKRLLRHYIEQVIEGKLENVEDLVAIATAPVVSSPINTALNLSDANTLALTRQFSFRSKLVLSFAVLFLLVLGLSLFYKINYEVKSTGVVLGNTYVVKASKSGVLESMYLKEGASVEENDVIATIIDPDITTELAKLNNKITVLKSSKQALLNEAPESIVIEQGLLAPLKQQESRHLASLERARLLLKDNVLTQKDYDYIENRWLQSLVSLRKEQQRIERVKLETEQALSKSNLLSSQRITEQLLIAQQELSLLEMQHKRPVTSLVAGRLVNTPFNTGANVTENDVVAIVETKQTPFLIIVVPNEQMLSLKLGQSARVYIPKTKTELNAHIVSFGRQSIPMDLADFYPKNTNQGIVKLSFDSAVSLPPFTRAKVWVDTFEMF
ncbi:MAG: HlyD family efflux transporter periplasmic adaptor subunit [Pseudomonadota bacterium]|nr:HlyD family efflux transporter periplasmic adaptor subunit [Pseudomonadota bacterium]